MDVTSDLKGYILCSENLGDRTQVQLLTCS